MQDRVIVFLKAPRVGEVKTRLGQKVGMDRAYSIYRELIEILFKNLESISDLELRVSPDGADISEWFKEGWRVRGQGDGNLTQRLQRAIQEAFSEGARRVVVIGSDCPEVTVEDIARAFHALETSDVVLGPAEDGGYWLIGMCRPVLEIFTEIPWSTEKVLEETLKAAGRLGCSTQLLRRLNDVDTVADWERFQRSGR